MKSTNEKYMQRCLYLANIGLRAAMPNPSVGAVLVFENTIIGEGFTSSYGGAHAEVNCIQSVKKTDALKISKSTLYVSLEPCSHFGKTPPCSDLIIDNKISKVVIGSQDPNLLVGGKGIKKLRQSGVNVVENILKESCEFFNRRFYTFHQKKRPYIVLKWAQTEQGIFAPKDGSQQWITNEYAKTLAHQWRSEEMAVMVGTKTAIADNPTLNLRNVEGINPTRILIDEFLEVSADSNLYNGNQPTFIFTKKKPTQTFENVTFFEIDFSKNTLKQILQILYENNIQSVLIEGGAFTINQFIDQNIWDEARILVGENIIEDGILAPKIEGAILEEGAINDNSYKILRNK